MISQHFLLTAIAIYLQQVLFATTISHQLSLCVHNGLGPSWPSKLLITWCNWWQSYQSWHSSPFPPCMNTTLIAFQFHSSASLMLWHLSVESPSANTFWKATKTLSIHYIILPKTIIQKFNLVWRLSMILSSPKPGVAQLKIKKGNVTGTRSQGEYTMNSSLISPMQPWRVWQVKQQSTIKK